MFFPVRLIFFTGDDGFSFPSWGKEIVFFPLLLGEGRVRDLSRCIL